MSVFNSRVIKCEYAISITGTVTPYRRNKVIFYPNIKFDKTFLLFKKNFVFKFEKRNFEKFLRMLFYMPLQVGYSKFITLLDQHKLCRQCVIIKSVQVMDCQAKHFDVVKKVQNK